MRSVRPAAVAGSWYPSAVAELVAAVDGHLETVRDPVREAPQAIVVPHAGLMYSGAVAAHAYAAVRASRPRAIVLVGPSHFVPFRGVSIWPAGAWETPLGAVPVAGDLAQAIAVRSRHIIDQPAAHAREHSLEMQLPFIARLLPDVPIVPLVMGDQSRTTIEELAEALSGGIAAQPGGLGRVLLVASSDLSHYEDARTAWRLDQVVVRHIDALDPEGLMEALEREPRHACGGGPMVAVLRGARDLGAVRARVLQYGDSGDVSGDKSSVVGYLAAGAW